MPIPQLDREIRVLLVEDDEDDYVLARDLLADSMGARARIDWAPTQAEGLERLLGGNYDVALVDYNLGTETGIQLLRAAFARGCTTPIIMLTGQDDRATDLEAMHAGAADFLVKGRVNGEMLERAIRYARERRRLLEQISALSLTDELTGLNNRRAFLTMADQRLLLLERRGAPCLLIYADLDGLKETNDSRGHEAGDTLLIAASYALRAAFRRTDLVARYGGDEFLVLADDAREGDIRLVLEKLQHQVDLRNAELAPDAPRLSITAGALSFQSGPAVKLQELIAEADALMIQKKSSRRRAPAPPPLEAPTGDALGSG